MAEAPTEVDPNFEPQARVRSNTWPLRPKEQDTTAPISQNLGLRKKTSSRRNAWGNLSYSDLITKAIDSSPGKRLTLSQIYDWMVQNVPFFKDKGESNSSAGWKVQYCFILLYELGLLSCHFIVAGPLARGQIGLTAATVSGSILHRYTE